MRRSRPSFALPAVFLSLALAVGCSEQANLKSAPAEATVADGGVAVSQGRAMAGAPSAAVAPDTQTQPARHIAYSHRYAIEAERAKLRAVLDAHLARCKQLDCEVVNQSYQEENDNQPPSANLMVRVAHKDIASFTEALKSGDGRVKSQSTTAEDKTLQVVDIEARVTNLQQLRERYRKLLADPKAGIKEAVEIERALAQAQSELDSLAAQRRVLAQQTERELFEIGYQARRSAIERSLFEPVKDALLSFADVFMRSVGALISFVAASLVWIALLVVLGLLIRRWRRRRSTGQ
jgi:chromosome segregation ATPase